MDYRSNANIDKRHAYVEQSEVEYFIVYSWHVHISNGNISESIEKTNWIQTHIRYRAYDTAAFSEENIQPKTIFNITQWTEKGLRVLEKLYLLPV